MSGDCDPSPAVACVTYHTDLKREICACSMQIRLKSSMQIRFYVVGFRLFRSQKRRNKCKNIKI